VTTIDVEAREAKVKQMYRLVPEQPHGNYHFELGRRSPSASVLTRSCCTESWLRVIRRHRVRLRPRTAV
jgi:hypothetical protein